MPYTQSSGVTLNAAMRSFLSRLDAATPGIPIHATSGVRTAEAQARALVTKRQLESDASVSRLYGNRSTIQEVLSVPNSPSAMASVLASQMRRGVFLSRHMRGDALDVRSRNLTRAQQEAVVNAARALGAKAIIEANPAHIHIEQIGAGSALVPSGGASRVPGWAWAAGGVLWLSGLAWLLSRRRR